MCSIVGNVIEGKKYGEQKLTDFYVEIFSKAKHLDNTINRIYMLFAKYRESTEAVEYYVEHNDKIIDKVSYVVSMFSIKKHSQFVALASKIKEMIGNGYYKVRESIARAVEKTVEKVKYTPIDERAERRKPQSLANNLKARYQFKL